MPDLEGVGEAVTGAAVARAVEPAAGAADDGHTHEKNCLNCGAPLAGPYCHECGQRGHVHRTIAAWWHDFLHSVLHLDGKFWRTLPMLAWRPGELTRRYAHGERARFISPLALFLFTVFLMFAVVSVAGPSFTRLGTERGLAEGLAESRRDLSELQTERQLAISEGEPVAGIDKRIAEKKQEIETLELLRQRGIAGATLTRAGGAEVRGGSAVEAAYQKAKQNPELLIYKLQTNAYKFSWALIPISVPFVWILFLHRRRYRQELTLYDHLVFVTYSIAFMSIALVAFLLLGTLGLNGGLVGLAFLLLPPVHIYRQLKQAYHLSRFSALWRTFALLVFSSVALGLFAALLLLMGVLG